MILKIQIQSCECTIIEYSSSYFETTGSLWFYSEEEGNNFNNNIANTYNFKSFKYRANIRKHSCSA